MSECVANRDHVEDQLQDVQQQLQQLDAFTLQVSTAIDQLVDGVLQVQQRLDEREDVKGLQQKLASLELQLQAERMRHDLSLVSRHHQKTRSALFVSSRVFSDNVKYTWLAMRELAQAQGIRLWYLPHDAEHERHARAIGADCLPSSAADWTEDHITATLEAAVVVTSDHLLHPHPHLPALVAGARHVQLWHGISIKEVGHRNMPVLKHLSARYARVLSTCGWFATFVGPAQGYEGEWRRWFGFERFAPLGYARNDVMHRTPSADDLVNVDRTAYNAMKAHRQTGRKVWFYAPTFRDADQGVWLSRVGLDEVASAARQQGAMLIVNLHPVEQVFQAQLSVIMPNVQFVAPGTDIYPLLGETDALITDYSSLMFDYLHLDRPIVIFRPDHEDYVRRSRKLFDDKLPELPGALCTDAKALVRELGRMGPRGGKPVPDPYTQVRHELAHRLFDQLDGEAGARIAACIAAEVDRVVPPSAQA
ncbi:MAG: hypothetical protein RI907_1326 [Pseudomonadota bacterium]|jgi:CDP-glycerol glycerophosphotransferase